MPRLKLTKLVIFLLIVCYYLISTNNLFSQDIGATPLNPGNQNTQKELGVFVGLGQNIQLGSYNPLKCDTCKFDGGNGFGFKAGLLYEFDINPTLQFGAAIGLNLLSVVSSYQDIRAYPATSEKSNRTEMVNILFRQKSETSLINLTLMPYIKWAPSTSFFARIGIEFGSLIYSHLKHTEELMQSTARLSDGELVYIKFKDYNNNIALIEDGPFNGVNSLQLYLVPAIGVNLNLAKNVFLTPVLDFGYPLTSISSKEGGFKVLNWRVLFELRVALQKRYN